MSFAKVICVIAGVSMWVASEILCVDNPRLVLVELDGEIRQEVKDWGFGIAPLDWYEKTLLRDDKVIESICRDSGASIVRLMVGSTRGFDIEKRGVAVEFIKTSLVEDVRRVQKAGVKRYILSLACPPAYMRRYYSYSPFIDGDSNDLRPECESIFGEYVAELVRVLVDSGVDPPCAVSFQNQPNCPQPDFGFPPTLSQGAVYSCEQWWRVLRTVRAALDLSGSKDVALIGPESLGTTWLSELASEMRKSDLSVHKAALSGIAFVGDSSGTNSEDAAWNLGDLGDGREIWMTASGVFDACNDLEQLLATFTQMGDDLLRHRASHWLFRYSFSWAACSESLVSGRKHNRTLIYDALCTLWTMVPVGSKVLLLKTDNNIQAEGVCLFGFRSLLNTTVVVCVNNSSVSVPLMFPDCSAELPRVVNHGNYDSAKAVWVEGGVHLDVEAKSVVFVEFRE